MLASRQRAACLLAASAGCFWEGTPCFTSLIFVAEAGSASKWIMPDRQGRLNTVVHLRKDLITFYVRLASALLDMHASI